MNGLLFCCNLKVDGAKLVSVNNRDEHWFIVRWLYDHAKQGYGSVDVCAHCLICVFLLVFF